MHQMAVLVSDSVWCTSGWYAISKILNCTFLDLLFVILMGAMIEKHAPYTELMEAELHVVHPYEGMQVL